MRAAGESREVMRGSWIGGVTIAVTAVAAERRRESDDHAMIEIAELAGMDLGGRSDVRGEMAGIPHTSSRDKWCPR